MTAAHDRANEFRESTRAPVVAEVILQLDTFSEPQTGYTGNVSMGGMFVRISDPAPVGTIVCFELQLGDPLGPVSGTAEVAWIRTASGGELEPLGMGLQFRFVRDDGLTKLKQAVDQAFEASGDTVEATRAAPGPAKPADCTDGPIHVESTGQRRRPPSQEAPPRPPVSASRQVKKTQKSTPQSATRPDSKDSAQLPKLIFLLALLAILVYVLTRVLG